MNKLLSAIAGKVKKNPELVLVLLGLVAPKLAAKAAPIVAAVLTRVDPAS